MYVSTKTLIKR